jgi:dTMP kinase
VDAALIDALALAVHGDLKPDCTLLLDLPVMVGLARARTRQGATADRFEAETVGFFEKVREGYLALARREPQRFRIIDAAAPLSEVEQRIAQALGELQARELRA